MSDGDSIEVREAKLSVAEAAVHDGQDSLDVRAGGDFGNDATVGSMDVDL